MAKRKRLTPAQPGYLSAEGPALAGPLPGPRAPIAQVAGEAAAQAAFHDLAGELTRAREEGRLVQALPLNAVRADHLSRDRMGFDPEEMAALKQSLSARGQQTPIEVVDLGGGAFGLISGWRRLNALRDLSRETGDSRFATVLALVRRPEDDASAYVAMVEENEIRADLSFFERARIVRRAVAAGVFADETAALQALFASASYSRRSKIKSFLVVVDRLGDVLRHPTRLSEHLGLKLVKALGDDPDLPGRIGAALREIDPEDGGAEMALLQSLLSHAKAPETADAGSNPPAPPASGTTPEPGSEAVFRPVIPGLSVKAERGCITLKGQRATDEFARQLEAWLKDLERG